MNAVEVNVLLTEAALRDPRMKRTDPREQADMAVVWAEDLAAVTLEQGRAAVRAHYATSREPIMIADILALVGATPVEDPWAHVPDVTGEIVEESKRRQLADAGVSEAEWEARKNDPAWIAATFRPALEQTPATNEGWLQ